MKSNRNGQEKDMLATQSHSLNQNSLWQSQEINLHNESLQEQSQFSYKGNHSLHNIDQHMKTTTNKFIVGQHNPALLDKFLGHRGTFTVTTSPLGMRKTSRHTLAVG